MRSDLNWLDKRCKVWHVGGMDKYIVARADRNMEIVEADKVATDGGALYFYADGEIRACFCAGWWVQVVKCDPAPSRQKRWWRGE